MILDLADFLRDNLYEAEYDFELDELPEELKDLGVKLPLQYHIKVYRIANIIEVLTTVNLKYKAICDRCLKDSDFEQTLDLESTIPMDDELIEFYTEDIGSDILVLENKKLDTAKLVRDIIVSGMPMRVICSEDCKGLCSNCGADLNEAKCNCDNFTIDPRLEALTAFKPD